MVEKQGSGLRVGLQYLVADKVKVPQYKVHDYILMADRCVLMVGESGHFTSTSTIVSALYTPYYYWVHNVNLHTNLNIHIL